MPDSRSMRDDALLLRGDAHDFAAFYRSHEDAVLGFFPRRTGGADLAADLTAETSARALEGRERFDLSPQENGVYLFVMRSASTAPVRLSITDRAGRVCRPFDRGSLQAGAPPGKLPRAAMACARLAGVVISR